MGGQEPYKRIFVLHKRNTTVITRKGQPPVFAEPVQPRIREYLRKPEPRLGRKINLKKTRGNIERPSRFQVVADHDQITQGNAHVLR